MTNDTAPDFDLGPLTWVQGEIDQALTRGLEALAVFKASPREITLLARRSHVHQAAGASDGRPRRGDGLYRRARAPTGPGRRAAAARAQDVCDLIDRACRKLKIFLDELVSGAYPVPLKLFPEYELMQQARGVKASAPTDLFIPICRPARPKSPR